MSTPEAPWLKAAWAGGIGKVVNSTAFLACRAPSPEMAEAGGGPLPGGP